jgi:hypothetical protein
MKTFTSSREESDMGISQHELKVIDDEYNILGTDSGS